MKRFVRIIVLMTIAIGTNAQVPSSCEVPYPLYYYYQFDVKHLALERLYFLRSPDTLFIEPPQNTQDTIWWGLAAIFNLQGNLETDSIFDKYCVHVDQRDSKIVSQIAVRVDTSYDWTHNWLNLQMTTGIQELDALFTKYGFGNIQNTVFYNNFWFLTEQWINTWAFCDSVMTFPGVISASPAIMVLSFHDLDYFVDGDTRYFDFIVQWGDCMSGCTEGIVWHYKVNVDCSVEFLGKYWTEWPTEPPVYPPSNCNISMGMDNNIQESTVTLYPNPAKNNLALNSKNSGRIKYDILNVFGETTQSGEVTGSEIENIDISNLRPGIYIMTVIEDYGQLEVYKFIKN